MSQPTAYNKATTFANESFDTDFKTKLDSELDNIETTIDETLVNLALIQRDDGGLVNGIVGADQLATGLYNDILSDLANVDLTQVSVDAQAAVAAADEAELYKDAAQLAQAGAEQAEANAGVLLDRMSHTSYTVTSTGATAYDMPLTFPALDSDVHNVAVFADGVKQADNTYTITDANTITFGVAITSGVLLEFIANPVSGSSQSTLQACQDAQAAAELAASSVLNTTDSHVWTAGQDLVSYSLSSSSNAVALDLDNGPVFTLAMTENTTISAPTNKPSAGNYRTFYIVVTQHASSAKTLAWNAVFKFPGGSAPTLSTGASAVDIFTIISSNGNLYVVASQDMK